MNSEYMNNSGIQVTSQSKLMFLRLKMTPKPQLLLHMYQNSSKQISVIHQFHRKTSFTFISLCSSYKYMCFACRDQTEKQFNFNKTKNVAFGSNVQTHDEEANFPAEKSEESGENEDISLENSSQSKSSSADSSLGSYTINHRYQNFRDNNGEDEYLGSDQSDEDNEDDVGDKGEEHNDEEEPSFDESKKLNQEMPVDTSLSDWLVSSETTLVKYGTNMPASNSVINHEDRPILGVLTLEEIKQFSTSCSPMKSPSKNLDELPIIGSVGTYWTHQDSSSASSFRGIPNTSSKYKEVYTSEVKFEQKYLFINVDSNLV